MRILFFGDIVGRVGLKALFSFLRKSEYASADLIIANGENVTDGKGISKEDYFSMTNHGIAFFTLGNHYDSKKSIRPMFNNAEDLVFPANLLEQDPLKQVRTVKIGNTHIVITSLLGQGFSSYEVKNPLYVFDEIYKAYPNSFHFVDFHGESTSEKKIFGFYVRDRAKVVVGTHTHVQTNDLQILSPNTLFMSDVGMCGASKSVIGFNFESVYNRLYLNEGRFKVEEEGAMLINGLDISFDPDKQCFIEYHVIKEEINDVER